MRKQLEKIISWKIGIKTDFSVSVGKSAKYMYQWIKEEEYEKYLLTYSRGTVEDCWRAVFVMTDLFSTIAREVSEKLGYQYNVEEEAACIEFLNIVHRLPKDADEIIESMKIKQNLNEV